MTETQEASQLMDICYGWFCGVTADVLNDDKVLVTLHGQIPQGDAVQAWMTMYGAEMSRPFHSDRIHSKLAEAMLES